MSLIVMDFQLRKVGEIGLYKSLTMTRSYCGTGGFQAVIDPRAPNALTLAKDRIVFLSGRPTQCYLIEDVTLAPTALTAKGTMLKGIAKRRVCVPPLSLPARLWRYAGGAWSEVTDAAAIRAALTSESVYQGFEKPQSPAEGALFLDMTELGSVYDWGQTLGAGDVVSDLGTAQLRSKYQNFGWDRFTGDAESAYLHFAANNLIAPEDDARRIPQLTAAANLHRGASLPWQARFDKLDALLEAIGDATELGWDVVPDYERGVLVFGAWQGRDLSTGATLCVVSEAMGNASAVTLKQTTAGSASTCYVGGSGEDENRLILSVGGASSGIGRRELWTECGSVSEPDMLTLYGQTRLSAAAPKTMLTADMLDSGACRCGRDYDVGDKVIVRDRYGSQAAARLTELSETLEGGKRTLSATFGDAPVSIAAAMGRMRAAAR